MGLYPSMREIWRTFDEEIQQKERQLSKCSDHVSDFNVEYTSGVSTGENDFPSGKNDFSSVQNIAGYGTHGF